MYVVIMSGGAGKRFWPRSRESLPKQFLKITGERSMLRETYERARRLVDADKIFVVTHERFRKNVIDELGELSPKNVLAEPEAKNTAPCIALALFYLNKFMPKEEILFIPSDHLISDLEDFCKTVQSVRKRMSKNSGLMVFGIRPRYAETGYGYIKKGVLSEKVDGHPVYEAAAFIEKPDKKKASQYLERGDYLWNSGMFLFSQDRLLKSFKNHMRKMYDKFDRFDFGNRNDFSPEKIKSLYSSLEPVSIDYGLIERESGIEVVECDFGWSDVGSWKALGEIWPSDERQNSIRGKYFVRHSSGIVGDVGDKVLAVLGVEDMIIVDTEDVVFVCRKDMVDEMKAMLDEMKDKGFDDYL